MDLRGSRHLLVGIDYCNVRVDNYKKGNELFKKLQSKMAEQNQLLKEYRIARDELDREHGRYTEKWKRYVFCISKYLVILLILALLFPAMALIYNNDFMPAEESHSINKDGISDRFDEFYSCIDLVKNNQISEGEECLNTSLERRTLFLHDLMIAISIRSFAHQENLQPILHASKERLDQLQGVVEAMQSYPMLQRRVATDLSIMKYMDSYFYKLTSSVDGQADRTHKSFLEVVTRFLDETNKDVEHSL